MRSASTVPVQLFFAILIFSQTCLNAQVYVVNTGTGYIGQYTTAGAKINSSLVFDGNGPLVTAVSGSNLYVVNSGETNPQGSIGVYTTAGATVNAALVTGIDEPNGFALSGSDLFLVNYTNTPTGRVSEYTTSGATVNASLISGFSSPGASGPAYIAISGSNLYLAISNDETGVSTVSEYTTSGAIVNSDLITVPGSVEEISGIAVSGSDLFVMGYKGSNGTNGTIGEFTTTGATVNASLVTGLTYPVGLAVSGADIYVTNNSANSVGEYTTSGAAVNPSLITGLSYPLGITVVAAPVPEPGPLSLIILTLCVPLWVRPTSRRHSPAPIIGTAR
jgi:hypothetical protein